MLSTSFSDLLDPAFRRIFWQEFGAYPTIYPQYMNLEPSTKDKEKYSEVSGTGVVPQKIEGQAFDTDQLYQKFDVTITNVSFGLEVRASHELANDDQFRVILRTPEALSASARHSLELRTANVYNNAETAGVTGGDGIVLAAATHPTTDAGNQSNILGTAADLSYAGLNTMNAMLRKQKSDRGLQQNAMARTLLIPVDLESTAWEILNPTVFQSGATNAQQPNYVANLGLQIVSNPHFTDADSWALLAQKHGLVAQWREMPSITSYIDKDTRDMVWQLFYRFETSFVDWRGFYYTPGAA